MSEEERAKLLARLAEIDTELTAAHAELEVVGPRARELGRQIADLTKEMEEIKNLLAGEPDPKPKYDIPTPLREVKIANGGELMEALKTVDPGTHLILQPGGSYPSTYNMIRPGTQKDPVYIRGPGSGVRFDGRVMMKAPSTAVAWLEFRGGGNKVYVDDHHCRATRLLFERTNAAGSVYIGPSDTSWLLLDHSDFVDITGAAVQGQMLDGRKHMNMTFAYNHVNGHRILGGNEAAFQLLTDTFTDILLTYESNLIEGCLKGATNQKEIVSGKTGGLRFYNNTFLRNGNGHVTYRETQHCIAEGNWLEETFFNVFGPGHVFRNNRGTGVLARVTRGDAHLTREVPSQCRNYGKAGRTTVIWKGGKCATAHCAGQKLLFEHNVGLIELGANMNSRSRGDYAVQDVVLRNNAQAAKRWSGVENVTETGVGNHTNTAKKLTPADVGRDA